MSGVRIKLVNGYAFNFYHSNSKITKAFTNFKKFQHYFKNFKSIKFFFNFNIIHNYSKIFKISKNFPKIEKNPVFLAYKDFKLKKLNKWYMNIFF